MTRPILKGFLGVWCAVSLATACDDLATTADQTASNELECKKEIAAPTPGGVVVGLLGCKSEPRTDIDCLPARLHEAANSDGGQEPFCVSGEPTDAASKLGFVSRASFEAAGKKWPLSVDGGFVGCTGTGARWFETRDGRRFGLNGLASSKNGYQDIKPIWLENTEFNERMTAENGEPPATPFRISIFDLSQSAAAHCR